MEFLGIGPFELVAILLIAILVIGPKDLERTARTLGRALNRIFQSDSYRAIQHMSQELRQLPNRLVEEAKIEELKKDANQMLDLDPTLNQIKQTWTDVTSPAPKSPPPPPPQDPPTA
jgi:sec-independent protein translocase protein TatB